MADGSAETWDADEWDVEDVVGDMLDAYSRDQGYMPFSDIYLSEGLYQEDEMEFEEEYLQSDLLGYLAEPDALD